MSLLTVPEYSLGFTAFSLKMIAIIAMFIDHTGYIYFKNSLFFLIVGRITIPIIAFFLVEGYQKTHDIKDPATKLFTFYTDRFSLYGVLRGENIMSIVLTVDVASTHINGVEKLLDAAPTIISNRTMVPLRFIGEAFGAKVDWQANTRTAVVNLEGKELRLTLNKKDPGLDVPPVIVGNRTMVPLRYISEALGAYVKWFPASRKIEVIR